MKTKSTLFLIFAVSLVACGGGGGGGGSGGGSNNPPPVVNASPGGIWTGTDSNGISIVALITETGRMHWVSTDTFEQGFGNGSVTGNNFSVNYTYLPELGFVLDDGSTFATCTGSGTILERQSLSVTINCNTENGGTFTNSAALSYDSLYDRDSSLGLVAGNYDDSGVVFNVNGNGVIFEQDPNFGCVINGQISIIDVDYNAYDMSMTISSCTGEAAILNGSTFTGIVALDNSETPETLAGGVTGVVDGATVAIVFVLPRM